MLTREVFGRDDNSVDSQPSPPFEFFKSHPDLFSFDYVLRDDGLIIIRLFFTEEINDGIVEDIINEISDIIKIAAGHHHEFHSVLKEESVSSSNHFSKVYYFFRNLTFNLFRLLTFSGKTLHSEFDNHLIVDPVEVENPFTDEYVADTGKEFVGLEEILEPGSDDKNIAQLRIKVNSEDGMSQRACLELRSRFTEKRDVCLKAFSRISNWIDELLLPGLMAVLLAGVSYYLIVEHVEIGPKTSLLLASLTGLGYYIYANNKVQYPKQELLQRVIGFYTYANVYSRIVENMYEKSPTYLSENDSNSNGCVYFNCSTGNFSDIIKGLETKYCIESQRINNQKYALNIAFALIAVMGTLYKMAVEVERLPSNPGGLEIVAEPVIGVGASARKISKKVVVPKEGGKEIAQKKQEAKEITQEKLESKEVTQEKPEDELQISTDANKSCVIPLACEEGN